MRYLKPFFCLVLFTLICGLTAQANAARIFINEGAFTDASRGGRVVPYRIYAPEPVTAPAPVVLFSHGLGGSIDAAPYLGEALAVNGYIAFFIQHRGSDRDVWRGTSSMAKIEELLQASIRNPRNALDRFKDVPFVINELTRLNSEKGLLQGKMDLSRIGMAGHSYGARSVMMAAGEKGGGKARHKEPRIKAAVALSPNIPERFIGLADDKIAPLYEAIDIPLFHITGTEDEHPFVQNFDPATRTLPYRHIAAKDQYLLVLEGADHSVFGGRGFRSTKSTDAAHHKVVADAAVTFFDAYLKGDANARARLQSEFRTTLQPGDKFEFK